MYEKKKITNAMQEFAVDIIEELQVLEKKYCQLGKENEVVYRIQTAEVNSARRKVKIKRNWLFEKNI